jgi:hypothetical protein
MAQEVGRHAVHVTGAVEHGRALPRAMIGGTHDGHVAIVPRAIEVGFDVGSYGHLDPPPAGLQAEVRVGSDQLEGPEVKPIW